MLAYYHYPFISNNVFKEYTEEDLMNSEIVERLFDYCQILEAYITKSGWDFLINHYGYEKLFDIDKKVDGLMMTPSKVLLKGFSIIWKQQKNNRKG